MEDYLTTSVLPEAASARNGGSRRSSRSSRSGGSRRSRDTGGSGGSESSVDSTATTSSAHSLRSLVNHISAKLYQQETLAGDLEKWLVTVDPEAYEGQEHWPPEVLAAYNEYKRRCTVHTTTHMAFKNYLAQTSKHTTPEEHLVRARLAVKWGEAAQRYVARTFYTGLPTASGAAPTANGLVSLQRGRGTAVIYRRVPKCL